MKFSHKNYEKLIDLVRERPALYNCYQRPDVAQEHVKLSGTHSKILYVFFFFQFQLSHKMIERAILSSACATINNKPTPNEIMISFPRKSRAVKARNPWKQICSTVSGTGFYCTAYCTVIHCTMESGLKPVTRLNHGTVVMFDRVRLNREYE